MSAEIRETGVFEPVPQATELTSPGPHAIAVRGRDLVLLRTGAGPRVYEGRCPHQGALLGEGELDGGDLVCRNHRWRFDVETGKRKGGSECLRACPSRETGGVLEIDVSALAPRAEKARATRRIADLPGPRRLPLIGNFLDLDPPRMHEVFEAWATEHGPMVRLALGRRDVVMVSDPTIAEPLFRGRPEPYRRMTPLEAVFVEMSANGVFSAEGESWRAQRRLAMEALSQRHLRGFYPTLHDITTRLHRRWTRAATDGRTLDLAEELKRFTVDVTTLLVFGYDLGTLEGKDDDVIQRHLEHVFPAFHRRLTSWFPYWRFFRLPQDRRLDHALAELHAWLTRVIVGTKKKLEEEPARAESPSNFIEAMLAARDAEGQPFTDDVIFGNALTMLLAGEDTTAYTIAWAAHHLIDAPDAWQALRAEADLVLGDALVPADLDAANRLPFATAVANEAMRLRPVAPHVFFEPTEDVVVGDVAVPRGTGLIALTRFPTRDARRFYEPLAFRPERWISPGAGGRAHDAAAHVPFGSGPRICPGRTLALVEMRVALSMMARSFDMERVGRSSDVKEVMAFTLTPEGLRVRLKRRASLSASRRA